MTDNHPDDEAIRIALASLPRTAPVPEGALAVLRAHRRRRRRRSMALLMVAAVVALVAAFAIQVRRSCPLPSDLTNELALDHLHYANRTDAAEVRGDPQTIAGWFSQRLGFTPHYGRIEAARFEGARACRIGGKWTALAWVDRAGHWLSLFAMPEHVARARGCTTAQGVRVCASPDPRGGARVLVGDLPESEMLRLVDESLQ